MENASKALLIAGGMLLVMLIVALLLFGWKSISDYYANEEKLLEIENLEKFNAQYTGFDRNGVTGNEIITLANKISDYNYRYSNDVEARNNLRLNPITLTIDLKSIALIKQKFAYNINNNPLLFTNTTYTIGSVNNTVVDSIKPIEEGIKIGLMYGGNETASKVARAIDNLVWERTWPIYKNNNQNHQYTDSELKAQLKKLIVNRFNALTKSNYSENQYDSVVKGLIENNNVYKYYEYYQFQKGKFNCTGFEYDEKTGRVSSLKFDFTGEIE